MINFPRNSRLGPTLQELVDKSEAGLPLTADERERLEIVFGKKIDFSKDQVMTIQGENVVWLDAPNA